MENRILARLQNKLGVSSSTTGIDPAWLLTLLSVLEIERYTLEEWNEAISCVLGRRVYCPSYRTLDQYLQRAVLGVK